MGIRVRIEGVNKLVRKYGAGSVQRAIGAGLEAGALEVKRRLADYPPQSGRSQPFKTAKQRGWFFAALKSGAITVPYRRGQDPRSEKLGQSWTIRPMGWHTVEVGTNVSYAQLVHHPTLQAGYHSGTWPTTENVARKAGPSVAIAVNRIVQRILGG